MGGLGVGFSDEVRNKSAGAVELLLQTEQGDDDKKFELAAANGKSEKKKSH